jgi:hypothetical protein
MRQLKSSVRAAGSRPMRDCLHLEDNSLIKHNFYTNKYDQTGIHNATLHDMIFKYL